ncbi:MAG TPA: outer membrane beta-barrel domain-containing protein [Myxococcales bacterium]|nr:outer membrane beta-barrel domain-containing protein [Myxococcales bacterium]
MIRKAALSLALVATAATAWAAEPEAVVVRNRLYSDAQKLELKVVWDTSLNNSLTSMNNLQLTLSYHFHEAWAVELLLGYAFGGPTDLFCQAENPDNKATCQQGAHSIFAGAVANSKTYQTDFPNLWTLNGPNAMLGVRWEPVYGKLSLLTELPIHFKWFLAVDGGVASFQRNSVAFCNDYNAGGGTGGEGDCNFNTSLGIYDTVQQNQYNWIASAATGLRFIIISRLSLEAAIRDYVWADSYPVNFSAADFSETKSNTFPTSVKIATGLADNLFADLGLSWTF